MKASHVGFENTGAFLFALIIMGLILVYETWLLFLNWYFFWRKMPVSVELANSNESGASDTSTEQVEVMRPAETVQSIDVRIKILVTFTTVISLITTISTITEYCLYAFLDIGSMCPYAWYSLFISTIARLAMFFTYVKRLEIVFENTPFRLSVYTRVAVYVILLSTFSLYYAYIAHGIHYCQGNRSGTPFSLATIFVDSMCSFGLFCLFVYKVIKQNMQDNCSFVFKDQVIILFCFFIFKRIAPVEHCKYRNGTASAKTCEKIIHIIRVLFSYGFNSLFGDVNPRIRAICGTFCNDRLCSKLFRVVIGISLC
ncbi:hypothetical protein RFI_19437 [Reticulomyxa filosa]|uniref:Uncharacterized protein n=1 Tax=Reticulomyxa filosa TaxID=46433 RepID=X6MW87_RETFI|nr:hypothetical protein RFI_19437 [Reticulomyxa filosa]|eukprot:ETO17871.1 hypothetical protein RFI_19437 [Reticulomyxa filosa]